MGYALTIALIVALVVVGARAIRRRVRMRRAVAAPGRTPGAAVRVGSWGEMDVRVRAARCQCGGELRATGEGTVRSNSRDLRRISLECRRCEETFALYFEVADS